jgi:hypothetical protein
VGDEVVVRLLFLALVAGACSFPVAGPQTDLPANLAPPKIVNDIDIDEESVCDFGYCGENRIAAAAGIETARYEALTVAPIGHRAAEELADGLARTFDGVKRPKVVIEDKPCGNEEVCTSGEYDGETIFLYDPTVGTLLHELAHHVQTASPYLTYDDATEDWRSHSDGFEWALRDVYLAYLAADVDHETLELPPLPAEADYAVGDCVEVRRFSVVACDGAHYAEVVEVVGIDDPMWPGDAVVSNRADRVCRLAVLAVSDDARFDWLVPTRSGWMGGDRHIICLLVP